MGLAAETSSFSKNPAALYSRCNAAKPRVCSVTGCAHLATKIIGKRSRKVGQSKVKPNMVP